MLYIKLADRVSTESEEVAPGIVLDFGERNQVVGIEIENAREYNELEYNQAVAFLDELTDVVKEDEDHPLVSLMELVGTLVEKYEDEHVPELA